MTEKLTRDMVGAAARHHGKTGGFWTDQLKNRDQLAAYHKMADEIWNQTGGKIDGFVQMRWDRRFASRYWGRSAPA